jgi:tetratricopeptide (TPR) repeat protein
MTTPKITLVVLSAIVLTLAATAEDSKDKTVPLGPPQPRVVEPFQKGKLPPRAVDPSWLLYQEGIRLYTEKRFGESLVSFQKAVDARSELFSRCASDIEASMAAKEAKRAKDSLQALVQLLAARDLIPQAYEKLHEQAAGSLVAEMGLIRETAPSAPLRGLIDATLLVVEERGISRVGDSLVALKKAVDDLKLYPEAESWIGRVYLSEGELRLAELQFQRAYEMSGSLELVQDRNEMLESLAGIYKSQGDSKNYESSLRMIADASDLFAVKDVYFRNAMERILAEKGVDKFMALYRIDEDSAVGAYSALGELYLDAGRPIATIYLAAAVNAILTRAIEEIKIDEPGYAYKDLADLVSRILANKEMSRFAIDKELWKDLILLGKSLSASGYRDTAREIWSVPAKAPAPEPWGKRAKDALSMSANASRRSSP